MASNNGKSNGRPTIPEKMLAILSDGQPHSRQELFACLYEQDAPLSNIKIHITAVRKMVRPRGLDVVLRLTNTYARRYQLVRLVGKGE